jgi:hypothetical protein
MLSLVLLDSMYNIERFAVPSNIQSCRSCHISNRGIHLAVFQQSQHYEQSASEARSGKGGVFPNDTHDSPAYDHVSATPQHFALIHANALDKCSNTGFDRKIDIQ